MPAGYSFNLDGSTLLPIALASIFVAQAAGIHLSVGRQLLIMLTLLLTSKGVAGVSRASIVILLRNRVGHFGLPVEPVFILLGIDQLMDMARTSVNVLGQLPGDCSCCEVGGRVSCSSADRGCRTFRISDLPLKCHREFFAKEWLSRTSSSLAHRPGYTLATLGPSGLQRSAPVNTMEC